MRLNSKKKLAHSKRNKILLKKLGNMNADGDELLSVYSANYITVIPANMQDSSKKSACEFYSKVLQGITGKQLYIVNTAEKAATI